MSHPIQKHRLLSLPVETVGGQPLGRISDFELDPVEQRIIRYYVRSGRLISGLMVRELIVPASSVVSMTEEKLVVEDAIDREAKRGRERGAAERSAISVGGT